MIYCKNIVLYLWVRNSNSFFIFYCTLYRKVLYFFSIFILHNLGRLDRNTSGVLLFTNEYTWVNKLTHPKYERVRKYMIHIEGPVRMDALKMLANGVYLKDEDNNKKKKKKLNLLSLKFLEKKM